MSKVVLQNGLIKGHERGMFGWSIGKILSTTSMFALLNALLIQYFMLSSLSSQFQKAYDQEVNAKVLAQLDGFRGKAFRAIQLQNATMMRDLAKDIMQLDTGYQMIVFYDSQGRYSSYYQRDDISVELVKSLTRVAALQSIRTELFAKKEAELGIVSALGQRTVDAVIALDGRQDSFTKAVGPRVGFVRLLASLDRVDRKLSQFRWFGAAAVFVTTIISSLLFIFTIRKTVSSPIERAVAMIRSLVENVERVPSLEQRKTDALQLKQLMIALYEGLGEISIRHRSTGLLEKTRKIASASPEEALLVELGNLWIKEKLAKECRVFLLKRSSDTAKYFIERSGEAESATAVRSTQARGERRLGLQINVHRDFMIESVLRFAEDGREIDWTNHWLFARAPLQVKNDESMFVLAVVPNDAAGVPPDRYEELCLLWLTEVSRVNQEVRYRSLVGDIEIARELHRKWIQFSQKTLEASNLEMSSIFACDSFVGNKGLGDFIFASNTASDSVTVTVFGTVDGSDLRSGLAATGIVASVADRFCGLRATDPERILIGLSSSINNYLWSAYRGKMTASCTIIVFDHEKGIGHFVSYGMRFPFLLTPMERKPMVIAQVESCGVLGGSDNFNFVSTSFPVVPGQIVLAGTVGFIEMENGREIRFSKHVLGGGLAEIVDNHYTESARQLLQRFVEAARSFGGMNANQDDMTCLLLMRRSGLKESG